MKLLTKIRLWFKPYKIYIDNETRGIETIGGHRSTIWVKELDGIIYVCKEVIEEVRE